MRSGMLLFEVLVHGRPVQEYQRPDGVFVEGRAGSEYTLRVTNASTRRAVAVISVDGLSVMTGQRASRSDSGYVIGSNGSVDIPGWRIDDSDVAHFFFGELPEAYATQMGKQENIGVIAAAIYLERIPEPEYHSPTRGFTLTLGGSAEKGIGTGFGRRTEHQVTRVSFDRESAPTAEMVIRYDTADGLRARGITVTSSHKTDDRVVDARPFPADERNIGAPPPPGWHDRRR